MFDRYVFHVDHYAMSANCPFIEHEFELIFTGLPEPARQRLELAASWRGVPLATVLQEGILKVAGEITGGGTVSPPSAFPHFLFGLDVETGGFEPGKHALLAIGCWWRGHDGATRTFRVLVQRQEGTIVEYAAAVVNGWESDSQWADAGAVPLSEAVGQLLEFVERLQQALKVHRLVPVSHNALLDQAFIQWALLNIGGGSYPVERWRDHVSHLWRCSMQALLSAMDAGVIPMGSASLDRLIELSGQSKRGLNHDAEGDARAALIGYEWLLAKLAGRSVSLSNAA